MLSIFIKYSKNDYDLNFKLIALQENANCLIIREVKIFSDCK